MIWPASIINIGNVLTNIKKCWISVKNSLVLLLRGAYSSESHLKKIHKYFTNWDLSINSS